MPKKIGIYDLLICVAMVTCTILLGGSYWYNCMIPWLFFFICLIKNRRNIPRNINAFIPAILLVTGFIAIVTTRGDKQNALYEYEQLLCLILPFFIGLSIKDEGQILKYIFVCATVTAIAGLLSYCGLIRIENFTFNDRYVLRLQSFLKYANTTAVLLGCGYFAVLKLFDVYQKKVLTYLSSCILIAFYLTVSKAAIPLFILIGTVLFVIQKKYARYFVLQNVICMIFAILIILAGFQQRQSVKLLLIVICVAISGRAILNDKLHRLFTEKRLIILWVCGLGVFLFLGCLLLVSKDINILETLLKRFDYMKDALVLLKEHWLTGIGPGAWKYYQYSAQTTLYSVSDIHNSWLQIWLEYGMIFFVTMVAVLLIATVLFARKKMYASSAIMLLIITHSLVDINFNFGIILIILGFMTGFALKDAKDIRLGKPVMYTTLAFCLALYGYMVCEGVVRNMFERSYIQNKNAQAIKYSYILEKICPYDSNLQISIAALTQENAEQRIKHAIELSPLDPGLVQTDIEYSISQKNKNTLEKILKFVGMAKHQEITYVKAKDYLIQALNTGICTQKEYDELLLAIENQRKQYGVIDRNNLLDDIAKGDN